MSTLRVAVVPDAGIALPPTFTGISSDVTYTRALASPAGAAQRTVQDIVRVRLDKSLRGEFDLPDTVPNTPVSLQLLTGTGAVSLTKTQIAPGEGMLTIALSAADAKIISAPDPQPTPNAPTMDRMAYFVPSGTTPIPFEASTLQIAAVRVGNGGWTSLGLDKLVHSATAVASSLPWAGPLPPEWRILPWIPVHVAIDGQFSFTVPQNSNDAWLWWLSGPVPAVGVVLDNLEQPRVAPMPVAFPPFAALGDTDLGSGRLPVNVTEAELASNPQVYTEDPGEFCKPFSNPERVLGERSFSVILRAEQPLISVQPSVIVDPLPTLTYSGAKLNAFLTANAGLQPAAAAVAVPEAAPQGSVVDDSDQVAFLQHTLLGPYKDMLRGFNRGRAELNAENPIQWESDVSRYQAVTVARGHILEYRMRWRSNGYSLGTVAKTLTLAPRQTKRIQKIEFRRAEVSQRTETTSLSDQVSDSMTHERNYDDAVQANLSEWERGSSSSSTEAGAGGFGFATMGFVIGGGGGASNANSASSQEGGRRTSAAEEQRLRDSIRRFGDSLRKLDSTVVNEVTQEETVTGTTEIVRNPNYGHSLTVIYYQILRHLKIETEVAGVRECLFVPFPITPFTVPRAYRWREFLAAGLRDKQYLPAIQYLKDVLTNFANSDIPLGRRSDQPVRYIYGSIMIRLAVERPKDKDDGSYDYNAWSLVAPYVGSPTLSIYTRLKAIVEAQRDAVFQQEQAPVIAASWVDTLELRDKNGTLLSADFTLATRYQFNNVVRVDFTVAISQANVTRETLSVLSVRATKGLPPGSVANAQSVTFTYQTDQFQRVVSASQGTGDLITVETGAVDAGATVSTIPDAWERQNIRNDIIQSVQNLIDHLNEHVEFYTKFILWSMDHDRLYMLLDGFYVPGTNQVSVASVVERDPIAIVGNCVVFRVAAGSFLGLGSITTPQQLLNYYVAEQTPSEPMLVSLPTDGLYAQTLMDQCAGLEEHFGSTDWVLNDPDPALGEIAPELLASRRAEPPSTQPSPLPPTLINLQNAPEAPSPAGLSGALAAVQNANAFRDMAGLAGTQANAAAAFQTAASLASSFGAQAAALKLAEAADKAHATQTADQKLATVQRALDKKLTTPEDAQQHTSQILQALHTAPDSSQPLRDALTQAISRASGLPGSSIEGLTNDGQVKVSLASAPAGTSMSAGATPAGAQSSTGVSWASRTDGIDINDANAMPGASQLIQMGIWYVIHKSSDGAGRLDTKYQDRREDARSAGVIYGSYHFFRFWTGSNVNTSVAAQIQQAAGVVQRVVPGEFGPSLDFEHQSWNDPALGHANPNNPWTPVQWATAVQQYFDGIETTLGRAPMIYTSYYTWHEAIEDNNYVGLAEADKDPDVDGMRNYPLWVVYYGGNRRGYPVVTYSDRLSRLPDEVFHLPTPWQDWTFWQWSGDKPPELPTLGNGSDMDVSNGGIYRLRGLADLDHTAPHATAGNLFIAYSEPDGSVRLVNNVGFWKEVNLTTSLNPQPPLAAGDPAATFLGDEQIILYRDRAGHIQALTRTLGSQPVDWTTTDVTAAAGGQNAAADPTIVVVQNQIHAYYWDTNDHQIHLTRTAAWHAEDLTAATAGTPNASGIGTAYSNNGVLSSVARAGANGELYELASGAAPVNLSSAAHAASGSMPGATFRPTTYTPSSGAARIVFRAVRGDIWELERDTMNATNLSVTAGHAPPSAGAPSAVFSDTAHVFFRSIDQTIIEMFNDAGTWRRRPVDCGSVASGDPTAFVDSNGQTAVSFRAQDGTIHIARLAQGRWTCEDAPTPPVDDMTGVMIA